MSATPSPQASFNYNRAFERNLGLVTPAEQERLKKSLVVILGAGGVGGFHAHALARMGIGKFRVVDPDTFDVINFNRQIAATMSTIGKPKASTIAAMIHDINPEAEVEILDGPLAADNAEKLIAGADIIIDGLDFFALAPRLIAHDVAWKLGIPVVIAGPIGMSTTLHVFAKGGMSFRDYIDTDMNASFVDRMIAFLLGLTPSLTQLPYMDMSYSNPKEGYGPSLAPACMLSAGVVGIEALRILLGRPGLKAAPHYYQFDAYRHMYKHHYLWMGNRNPIQRIKRFFAKRMMLKLRPELRELT